VRIFWPVVQAAETAYVVPSAVLGRAPTTLADRSASFLTSPPRTALTTMIVGDNLHGRWGWL
jgi:hypothetical protein